MPEFDTDLRSIQEARDLATACRAAQREWATASQEQVDRVCAAMADVVYRDAARLGRLAHEETGYGVAAHKQIKIEFASKSVWESIKDEPTVGVLRRDAERRTMEIGWPVGVIVAPVVPGLNDHEIAKILEAAAQAGARSASWVMLRLAKPLDTLFDRWLTTNYPDRRAHVLHRIQDVRAGRLNDTTAGPGVAQSLAKTLQGNDQTMSMRRDRYGINHFTMTPEEARAHGFCRIGTGYRRCAGKPNLLCSAKKSDG